MVVHELEIFYRANHYACRYEFRVPAPIVIQEFGSGIEAASESEDEILILRNVQYFSQMAIALVFGVFVVCAQTRRSALVVGIADGEMIRVLHDA
jgi:hypothetical protein